MSQITLRPIDANFMTDYLPSPFCCPLLDFAESMNKQTEQHRPLVAPYCAIPRDYLSDIPLLRTLGFLVSQRGQTGAIPPSPFLSVSPLEGMRRGGAIPPLPERYLSDTFAIPSENKAKCVRYPPLRYYLERVLRDMGGCLALGC